MSRKRVDDFDDKYLAAIRAAALTGRCHFPLAPKKAETLRSYFYHFRRVLKEQNHPMYEEAKNLKFRVDGGGLTIYPRGIPLPTSPDLE